MRKANHVAAIVFGLLIFSATALAETIPGRWEKVDALQPGTGIIVSLEGGERLECEFVSADDTAITIRESGAERNLPKSGVQKIVAAEKKGTGPLWTGAVIGALVGVAVGGIVASQVNDSGTKAGDILGCAAIGAGVGLGIDAAVGARETFYKAR